MWNPFSKQPSTSPDPYALQVALQGTYLTTYSAGAVQDATHRRSMQGGGSDYGWAPWHKMVRVPTPDGVSLAKANLTRAMLQNCNLTFAQMPFAILNDADLRGADLHGANLTKAQLNGADLRGADLRNVRFTDAILINADLRDAVLVNVTDEIWPGSGLLTDFNAQMLGAKFTYEDLEEYVSRQDTSPMWRMEVFEKRGAEFYSNGARVNAKGERIGRSR